LAQANGWSSLTDAGKKMRRFAEILR